MSYVNNFQCCGYLAREPETLYDEEGRPRTLFVVALNNPRRKAPSYIDCIVWGDVGIRFAEMCNKGSEVYLQGELETNTFTDSRGSKHKTTCLVVEKWSISKPNRDPSVLRIPKPQLAE
jgi:single-stranded DNA-binding protein